MPQIMTVVLLDAPLRPPVTRPAPCSACDSTVGPIVPDSSPVGDNFRHVSSSSCYCDEIEPSCQLMMHIAALSSAIHVGHAAVSPIDLPKLGFGPSALTNRLSEPNAIMRWPLAD